MARPLRIEYEGGFYHVTSRGNERMKIFYGISDYEKFKAYLREAQDKYGYLLHAYVLMRNHYHLLIETPKANLSQVMHFINGSYTNYVNKRRRRSGHLFQGRYKAILIERDSYLLELSRYIHLNPCRAGMVAKPEDYTYSSYREFIAKRKDVFVYRDLIWEMISGGKGEASQKYKSFVEGDMGKGLDSPLKNVFGGAILGGERFIKDLLNRLNGGIVYREEVSHRKELRTFYEAEEMIGKICEHLKISLDEVKRKKGGDRKMVIYLTKKMTGMTNRQTAELFGGITCSAVAKTFERFSLELKENRALNEKLEILTKQLSNVKG